MTVSTIGANVITAGSIAASALDGKGNWNVGKTGYALSTAGIQAIWDAATSLLTTVGSIGKLFVDNINATISSRSTYAGGDTSGTTTLLTRIVGTLAAGTHNAQSGDSFARLGAPLGASVSADILAAFNAAEDARDSAISAEASASTASNKQPVLRYGIAQAGAASTITLDAGASSITDYYVGLAVAITSGTGAGQIRTISAYNGTSKVATVSAAWTTNPASGSGFALVQAAGSGSGGTTDWTANERTAIRAILGVPTSGTTPETPTTGVLDSILDKALLITSTNVTSSNPVTSTGQITSPVFIGDDYLHANGRAFSWTIAARSGVTAATATCFFGGSYGTLTWLVQGTVVDNGNSTWTLRFELPKTITGSLVAGFYAWSVELRNAAGTEITEVASGRNVDVRLKQT